MSTAPFISIPNLKPGILAITKSNHKLRPFAPQKLLRLIATTALLTHCLIWASTSLLGYIKPSFWHSTSGAIAIFHLF